MDALGGLGYVIETDWRPVRVEVVVVVVVVAAGLGRVDVHPVTFDEAGHGHQGDLDGGSFLYPKGCFTIGTIAGSASELPDDRATAAIPQRQRTSRHRSRPTSFCCMAWPQPPTAAMRQPANTDHTDVVLRREQTPTSDDRPGPLDGQAARRAGNRRASNALYATVRARSSDITTGRDVSCAGSAHPRACRRVVLASRLAGPGLRLCQLP